MEYRAVITDLDNTLLRSDKTVSAYSRSVLEQCLRRGLYVMAASARPERTIREFCGDLPFSAVVALNGARILLPDAVLENAIPRESGARILAKLVELPGACISLEMSGGIYSDRPIPAWNATVFHGFPRLPEGRLYKFLVSGVQEGDILPALTEDTYCTPIENGRIYQIMSWTATKWSAVRAMLSAFGLTPEEAVYFGDDYDDIEPVRNCGLGVAMANAIAPVKEAAALVTGGCDEDGVARYIEKELLSGYHGYA